MSVKEKIKNILIEHRGKENGITSNVIAKEVGIEPGPSNVSIRTLIKEVLIENELPIGSSPTYGYYFIVEDEELKEYQKQLDSRVHGILYRKYIITYFYEKHYHKDIELTEEVID